MVASAGTQLLMPRVFYSDPEVTVGWKARWHVSVLAPVMTLTALAVLNEHALKDSFEGFRPGCNALVQACRENGEALVHHGQDFALVRTLFGMQVEPFNDRVETRFQILQQEVALFHRIGLAAVERF